VLGYGSQLLYGNGKACFLQQNTIHFVDVHSRSDYIQPAVSNSPSTFNMAVGTILAAIPGQHSCNPTISLLSFNDDILTLLYQDRDLEENWLMAVDISVTKGVNREPEHMIQPKLLTSTSRLFARHTRDFLYYGTHSATGGHGHKEWIIQGISMNSEKPFPAECRSQSTKPRANDESVKIQLYDFPGMDLGSTVVFKIHEDNFYALSNCSSFDVVEVDWTSFYHIRKFPLNKPPSSESLIEKNPRIYRRQHWEGPVNDSWTDLSLQVDERTNELMIVESRREWRGGSSSQTRTFYTSKITFEEEPQGPRVPENDAFGPLSTSDSKYAPEQERLPWQVHPESNHRFFDKGNPCYSPLFSKPDSFILAYTPFRSYNLSANAWVDIVTDPNCCQRGSHCVKLRAGSRRPSPLVTRESLSWNSQQKGKAKAMAATRHPTSPEFCPTPQYFLPMGEEDGLYRYSPIYTWPPPEDASMRASRAHDILNPDTGNVKGKTAFSGGVDVEAIADERAIVYLTRDSSKGPKAEGKIVCICFDGGAGIVSNDQLNISRNSMDVQVDNGTARILTTKEASEETAREPPDSKSQDKMQLGRPIVSHVLEWDFSALDNIDKRQNQATAVSGPGKAGSSAAADRGSGLGPSGSGTTPVSDHVSDPVPFDTQHQSTAAPPSRTAESPDVDSEMLQRYEDDVMTYDVEHSFDELWVD
jgi:hypothetical protein